MHLLDVIAEGFTGGRRTGPSVLFGPQSFLNKTLKILMTGTGLHERRKGLGLSQAALAKN